MLNQISRKYFNRAFLSSGTALSFHHFAEANHLQRMMEYSKIDDKDQLIEYLKVADSDFLSRCYPVVIDSQTYYLPWVPTIESPEIDGAFITTTPEQIYNSNEAPIMDVMFSFNSKVSVHLNIIILHFYSYNRFGNVFTGNTFISSKFYWKHGTHNQTKS